MLDQTLRYLSDEYLSNWQSALEAADSDPLAQLCALIEASFATANLQPQRKSASGLHSGASRAHGRSTCASVALNDKAFSDKLLSLCEAIEAQHGARLHAPTAALSIEGMIDGLWQNFLIGPSGFKRDRAIQAVFELFDTIYPDLRRS